MRIEHVAKSILQLHDEPQMFALSSRTTLSLEDSVRLQLG